MRWSVLRSSLADVLVADDAVAFEGPCVRHQGRYTVQQRAGTEQLRLLCTSEHPAFCPPFSSATPRTSRCWGVLHHLGHSTRPRAFARSLDPITLPRCHRTTPPPLTAPRPPHTHTYIHTMQALYAVKFVFIVLGSDMWTYWKHRSLHSRTLWAFHKSHHAYHDPTCFAGFALHPVEGTLTFAPILLFCNSSLGVYAPLHVAMLGFFSSLNFYLHCGHRVGFLERWLPRFWVNTSLWHNRHHEKTVNHYGTGALPSLFLLLDTRELCWEFLQHEPPS